MLKHLIGLISPRYRFRSAVTGLFVSKLFALAHPATTIREHV